MIFSKIRERAKNEEMKAKIVVRKIVAPIVEYLMTSKLGQREYNILANTRAKQKKIRNWT